MLSIDIVIPVYNKNEYIGDLLQLLLSRRELYDGIILVDDCSTDGSVEKICKYRENYPDKITVFLQSENKGPHHARMKGAELSDKQHIMFVDADDLIDPDGLERFLNANVDWTKFGIYYGKTLRLKSNKILNNVAVRFKHKEIKKTLDLCFNIRPTMSGLVIRKNIVSLMSIGNCNWGEDILFYVKAIEQTPFLYIDETIGIYRLMENSRGNSNGSLKRRLQFIGKLRTIIKRTKRFSVLNILFFVIMSIRVVLAWIVKSIQK